MALLVVTRRLVSGASRLEEHSVRTWEGGSPIPDATLAEWLSDAEGLLCMLTDRIDEPLLRAAPKLRVVSQCAVGVDNIDLEACTQRGIVVGHTPDVLTETTADTAFGLLCAGIRRFGEGMAEVEAGEWGEWNPEHLLGGDVHGATLGLVGLGRIGAAVARRAAGFDMRVRYTGPNRKPLLESRLRVSYREFDELLEESDAIVIAAPSTEATRHMFGRPAFEKMRSSAVLVNISRGDLVDTAALVWALQNGQIAGAALDVTDPEPIPADHPLVAMRNCLIVPHIGSASRRTRAAMSDLAVANLLAGVRGERVRSCANPTIYE
jgi:lactate dehydrogenase-like 2-hydroxyacid dehydrogenase